MRNVPLILRKWGGGGGGESLRSDRNLDNSSDSFDKHVSLITFSHLVLCFGAILQFFDFDLVIV